jgi:hypothetical protein
VYSPGQIQQQVNQSLAATGATTASNIKQAQQRAAGSNLGANSPLAQALAGQAQAAGLQASEQARTDIPLKAAQANAAQALGVGGLANQQYASQMSAATQQYQSQLAQQNAIFQAIMGMLGSIA